MAPKRNDSRKDKPSRHVQHPNRHGSARQGEYGDWLALQAVFSLARS